MRAIPWGEIPHEKQSSQCPESKFIHSLESKFGLQTDHSKEEADVFPRV